MSIYLSINLPFCILDYRLSHQKQRPKALRQDWVFILTSPQITNNWIILLNQVPWHSQSLKLPTRWRISSIRTMYVLYPSRRRGAVRAKNPSQSLKYWPKIHLSPLAMSMSRISRKMTFSTPFKISSWRAPSRAFLPTSVLRAQQRSKEWMAVTLKSSKKSYLPMRHSLRSLLKRSKYLHLSATLYGKDVAAG